MEENIESWGEKRVNRKKKIQEAGVILIAGILVIFGVFLGVKFIPKHQQENISITKPNKNENGTSNNEDKVDNNKLDNSGYLSFEEDPNADDAAMVAENTKGLLNGTKHYPVRTDGKKVVYLTFDDGPSTTNTPQVLDVLDKYNVKATFFVLGSSIDKNDQAKEILKEEVESRTCNRKSYI